MSVPGSLHRGLTQWWDRLDKFKVECHSTRTERSQVYSTAETSDQSLVSTWLDVKRGTSTLISPEMDRESGGVPAGGVRDRPGGSHFQYTDHFLFKSLLQTQEEPRGPAVSVRHFIRR